MKERHVRAIRKSLHVTSKVLFLKGIVGGSVAALAAFGIMVPVIAPAFGIEAHPSALSGGIVASIGAIVGAVAAARA